MGALAEILTLLLLLGVPAPDAEALYQEALYRRKILGDLEGAVTLLERASEPAHPVGVRARAVLQRVECLRDLDRVEDAARLLDDLLADVDLSGVAGVRERVAEIEPVLRLKAQSIQLERRLREGATAEEAATLREQLAKLRARIEEAERTPAEPAESEPDWDEILRREREARERGKAEAARLLEKGRELESRGDLEVALFLLELATRKDPENVAAAEAYRAIRRRAAGRALPTDDPRRAFELELEVRREMIPRHVDELFDRGRERFREADYQAAADIFFAILQIHRENPELAAVLVDKVRSAREFLEQAVERGARPSLAGLRTDDGEPRDWLRDLYDALDGVRAADGGIHRFYPLAHLDRPVDDGERPPGPGRVRATRPDGLPAEALAALIRARVASGTWDGEARFVRIVDGRRLVVRHEPERQREVEALLTGMAREPGDRRWLLFDVAVLTPRELEEITGALDVRFRERGPVAVAVLDDTRVSLWGRRTKDVRRVGRAVSISPIHRPVRFDATSRTEGAVVGHREGVAGGRSVRLPEHRVLREGLLVDALAVARREGGLTIGLQGSVDLLTSPVRLRSAGEPALRWPTVLSRTFALAADVPEDGALIVTGIASPFSPRREGDVLAFVVALGDLPDESPPTAADGEGIPVEDLTGAEDAPGESFEMERIWKGPTAPLGVVDLVRAALEPAGHAVEERAGHLVPSSPEARDALLATVGRRRGLVEIRARVERATEPPAPAGPEVKVDPGGGIVAWRTTPEAPLPADDAGLLDVGRIVARQLQRTHLSNVLTSAYVREYVPGPEGARPVMGRVGRGIVLDARGILLDGDAVLLSVLAKVARLEGIDEVEVPSEAGNLPVSSPRQVVRRGRVLVRLEPGRRLVLAGLPDPFGEGSLVVEIEARRLTR